MSIKYKIPCMFAVALVINIMLLIGFYRFFLQGRVEQYQENMRQTVNAAAHSVSADIDDMSIESVCRYLEEIPNDNNLLFILTAVEDGKSLTFGEDNESPLGFTQSEIIWLSDGAYVLQVSKNIQLFNFRTHDIFRDLLYAEIAMITVLFVALGVIIHLRYVRSLLQLGAAVSSYKSGALPRLKPSGRDEIGRIEQSFLSLSQSLYNEKQTQNRIIASISHDIKTPLTSVLGYSEQVLKKDLPSERQSEYLRKIHDSAQDIAAIVDEFDDYLGAVIPETSKMQNYQVSYICQMLTDEYEQKLRETGGVFIVENCCSDDTAIHVDLLGLRRVFANIIGNSLRHAGVEHLELRVMAECSENVRFSISDNGKGINDADLAHLFEPFYTSDKSRRLSGLGLSICKQITEAMDGTVSALVGSCGGLTIELALPHIERMGGGINLKS